MAENITILTLLNSTQVLDPVFTTPADKETNSNYRLISFIIAWLILLLSIFGIIGNAISISIYCSPSMRSPINTLLSGLSFIDLSLSIFAVPTFVVPGFYAYYGTATLRELMAYIVVYIYPVALTLQSASAWTFVVITIERWLTVSRRYKVRLSSVYRARKAILIVCILALAYNLVRFFEFRLVDDDRPLTFGLIDNSTDHNSDYGSGGRGVTIVAVLRNATVHPVYMNVYYIGIFLFSHFIVPFPILVVLNGLIVAAICQSRRRRVALNKRERSEHRTATMIIIVVATFIICYTLNFSLNIMEAVDAEWFYESHNMVLAFALNDTSNLLVVANASTTVVVYYYFSGKYRYKLITVLSRLCPCWNWEPCLALRKQAVLEDALVMHSIRRLSASAGVHALFMVVARTAESKRAFLLRKKTRESSEVSQNNNNLDILD